MFWHDKFLKLSVKLKQLKMKQILRQECGSILIFTAAVLPILLGLTGIAFDVGNLYMHKARLQNVVDAAALAGARAFADSQANADENDRDKVDENVTYTSYKPSVTYSIDDRNRTKIHGTQETPLHPHADAEADKYIYNNLNNLGGIVSSDIFSHFAVLSKETNPKTYYRVGLAEEVELHFLPVIRGIGKKQTVGAEAIVLLFEEKGDDIPLTVFDNLMTYSGKLTAQAQPDNSKKVLLTFDGQIVYTGDKENKSEYLEVTNKNGATANDNYQHLYADVNKAEENDPVPFKQITGTTIDTSIYMETLKNYKLKPAEEAGACVVLDMSNLTDRAKLDNNGYLTAGIINNNPNKKIYEKQERDKDNNLMYYTSYVDPYGITKKFIFSIDQNINDEEYYQRYYSFDEVGKKMYCFKVELNNHTYRRIPAYEKESGIGPFTVSDDKGVEREYDGKYILDSSMDKIYYSLDIVNNKVYFIKIENNVIVPLRDANSNDKIKPLAFNLTGTHFKYTASDGNNRLINYIAIDNAGFYPNPKARILTLNTNVFHLINGNEDTTLTTKLLFNAEIKGFGNANEPIYIFDDTGCEMYIEVDKSNNRPIVIIHDSEKPITIGHIRGGSLFNCTIYAPEASVSVTPWSGGGNFKGNIMAKDVSIIKDLGSNKTVSSFTQENHLENDSDLYSAILEKASTAGQLLSDPSNPTKPPTNTWNSSWENWYSMVGSTVATEWFNSLNHNQQVAFWRTWDAAHRPPDSEEYNELFPGEGPYSLWYDRDGWRNDENGWPFKEWEGPSTEEKNAAKTNKEIGHFFDTKMRLINPRLEAHPFKL